MLEKMGWTSGKGLGKEQQGEIDPIALKQKDDNKGIGFEVREGKKGFIYWTGFICSSGVIENFGGILTVQSEGKMMEV